MARRKPSETDAIGSDSFLDVVSNIVGILIILVMVVGMRVRRLPASADDAASPPEQQLLDEHAASEREVIDIERQTQLVDLESQVQRARRDTLALKAAALAQELDQRKATMDASAVSRLDHDRAVASAVKRVEEVRAQVEQVESQAERPAVEIKSYQLALSRTVTWQETHFRVAGGRVTRVPIHELEERFKREARAIASEAFQSDRELTGTVGPLEGWRLQYVLERTEIPIERQLETGVSGSVIALRHYTLIPANDELGERVDQALGARSEFRRKLAELNPRVNTITLWIYPDGFADYRRVKDELYRLGFTVAGRPLPEGQSIGASPHGSRSAAQ